MPSINHQPSTNNFSKLCQIVSKLRQPGGCPWDAEQTNESLLPATIEEAYEVAEAARSKNDTHFREELGDLLLLVVMHAEIAGETGRFEIAEVIEEVTQKLIRRHPHVFATSDARDSEAVVRQWEAIKREEKAQKKVARVNFDWEKVDDVLTKVEEELGETRQAIDSQKSPLVEDEIGDLLFAVVNLARKCGIDAESALQKATEKFRARFNRLEDELKTRGKKLGQVDLAEMDEIWNQIKKTPNTEHRTPNAEQM